MSDSDDFGAFLRSAEFVDYLIHYSLSRTFFFSIVDINPIPAGGLAATTPNIPRLKTSSKPNGNREAEAGPSKYAGMGPALKAGNKKRPAPNVQDESDEDDVREVPPPPKKSARSTTASRKPKAKAVSKREEDPVEEEEQRAVSVEDDEDNDVEVFDHMPKKNAVRGGSKSAANDGVNGHAKGGTAAAKGKGKGKAKSTATASSKPRNLRQEPAEVMDIDSVYGAMEVGEHEAELEEIEDQRMTMTMAPPINTFGKSGVKGGKIVQAPHHAKNGEEERLRERLRQVCSWKLIF